MIDIELDIFDACARRVLEKYPDAVTSSQDLLAPASFPAISIIEADNMVDSSRRDSSGIEKGAFVSYDIKVFSNLRRGAKAQAKEIFQIIDEYLYSINFTRGRMTRGESSSDPSVYLITARYTAGVTENNSIYRR